MNPNETDLGALAGAAEADGSSKRLGQADDTANAAAAQTGENSSGRPDGKRGPARSPRRLAAAAAGMSRHQLHQALALASTPEADFHALVESDDPPTVTALAEIGRGRAPRKRDRAAGPPCPNCGANLRREGEA